MPFHRSIRACRTLLTLLLAYAPWNAFAANASPPDVLLIVVDDLGFSDVGAYGAVDLDTPNLDRLAAEGLRFSRFRVQPMCTTTRVAMLTGVPLRAGADLQHTRVVAFPKLLKDAGWTTSMTGKWHAGTPDARDPALFDCFFGFLGGMTDSFAGGPDFYEGAEPFSDFGPGFYTTHAFGDHALAHLAEATSTGKPHFQYVSYNAPHHPCQAPRRTVEKYLDRYAAGYDEVHAARLREQRRTGLLDGDWPASKPGAEVLPWDELSNARRSAEAEKMAAYAATVDEIDRDIGRLLDALDASGRADDTLVIFLSDNGADYANGSRLTDAEQTPWARGTNPTSSNGWAWVKNTPFRSYKHAAYEGGIASPLIVRWPAGVTRPAGETVHAPASVVDLVPTLLELAGVEHPSTEPDSGMEPLLGASLLPLLDANGTRTAPPQFTWFATTRAYLRDEQKAVQIYDGAWELYDLRADRTETRDLAAERPEQLRSLVAAWNAEAEPRFRLGVDEAAAAAGPVGWGWHRLQRLTKNRLRGLHPANAEVAEEDVTALTLTFDRPLAFPGGGRGVRLFSTGSDEPLWETCPGPDHPATGDRSVTLSGFPPLAPDAAYFVEWDAGWVTAGGQPVGPLNDGAYWWRFRTPPAE